MVLDQDSKQLNQQAHKGNPEQQFVNIGKRERKFRLAAGFLLLAAGWILSFWYIFSVIAMGWLILLFVIYYQSIRFLFDYKTGTCPLKAELGQEKLDAWISVTGEDISNVSKIKTIKSISRKALLISLVLAAVLTLLTYFAGIVI